MHTMHLCFLLISIGISQAAELVQPNPPSCELVVNNFAETRSETHNSLGFEMKQAGGMQTSLIADDDDPHLLLTPDVSNPSSSFWYSFLRKPGQCFDASNFDFLSLELKGGPGDKILIGFSTNPIHCDESAESVIRYSMLYITKSSENDSKRQIDIPFSKLAGDATKSNFGAVVLGGLTRPLELYSVKLKGMCATGITNETLISDRYQNMTDSDSETDSEDKKDCILVVDDFANEESKENALRGTHGADDSMSVETYSADHGLLLTSANVSSYWYTVIPCMKFKHYDMLVLDIAGPFGGDFELEIKTKVGCDTKFKDFKFMASSFLDGTLTGEQQQLIIPFDKLEDFDNTIHTIGSIIVGGFLNEDRSSPMTLNIKSITFRRENCTDDDGTEEHIQAKEKGGHPVQKEETDATHSYSSSSRCTLSAAALVLMTFLFTL